MNMGMVIRKGITKNWSFETGICFVQRNFSARVKPSNLSDSLVMSYRMIAYEIPLQALVFVKLGEHLYMNASGGCSLDFYPSNVESYATALQDTNRFDVIQKTWRRSWIQPALIANYGLHSNQRFLPHLRFEIFLPREARKRKTQVNVTF
jgi:hypothetical protein